MTTNRRYAESLQRRRLNKAAELRALQPRSLTPEERGNDVRTGPSVPVRAWVTFGDVPVEVLGFVVEFTSRAVRVMWQGVDGERREAWLWSSAVQRVADE